MNQKSLILVAKLYQMGAQASSSDWRCSSELQYVEAPRINPWKVYCRTGRGLCFPKWISDLTP